VNEGECEKGGELSGGFLNIEEMQEFAGEFIDPKYEIFGMGRHVLWRGFEVSFRNVNYITHGIDKHADTAFGAACDHQHMWLAIRAR
jgi:hypothetical protein